MIISPDVLFIHIPKTAGMSSTDYLCENLRGPVGYFSIIAYLGKTAHKRADVHVGINHETLTEVFADRQRIEDCMGFGLDGISKYLAVIRHPYDLEMSIYRFFRNGRKNALRVFKTSPNIEARIDLAQGSFRDFVVQSGYFRKESNKGIGGRAYRSEDYLLVDGELPEKLEILKFEDIEQTLPAAIAPYLRDGAEAAFPHRNRSLAADEEMIVEMDSETRELIVDKHRWLFEQGYYLP